MRECPVTQVFWHRLRNLNRDPSQIPSDNPNPTFGFTKTDKQQCQHSQSLHSFYFLVQFKHYKTNKKRYSKFTCVHLEIFFSTEKVFFFFLSQRKFDFAFFPYFCFGARHSKCVNGVFCAKVPIKKVKKIDLTCAVFLLLYYYCD